MSEWEGFFLLGLVVGFSVTSFFWIYDLKHIIKKNRLREMELLDQLEYEKADKQTP